MQSPWAVILCKFNDGDDEPFPLQYYKDLFTADDKGSSWNMIRYFHDCAHGKLDLTGTKVFGWYSLDKSVADYNALGGGARDQLVLWARKAATDHGVNLSPFYSVVVCTNRWHDIGVGPAGTGVIAQGTTAIPRLLGHEMGHVYGLQHSRVDGSTEDYKDPWDIMSAALDFSAPDPEFSLIGPVLNASNMRSRGWLDETRVWKPTGNLDETVTLRPLARHDLPGHLAAEIPGGRLFEFRVREGWDGTIPRPAVLVHHFEGGHSYLMPGNSGSFDLIAGDSFGDAVPSDPNAPFQRVDVISIDEVQRNAVLRIRYRPVEIPMTKLAGWIVGLIDDSPGGIVGPGGFRPVPLPYDILLGLANYRLASLVSGDGGVEIQKAALKMVAKVAQQELRGLQKGPGGG